MGSSELGVTSFRHIFPTECELPVVVYQSSSGKRTKKKKTLNNSFIFNWHFEIVYWHYYGLCLPNMIIIVQRKIQNTTSLSSSLHSNRPTSIQWQDLFFFFFFYWRIVSLQNFAFFCQTSTWISHRYTYIPSLLNLPPISLPSPPL